MALIAGLAANRPPSMYPSMLAKYVGTEQAYTATLYACSRSIPRPQGKLWITTGSHRRARGSSASLSRQNSGTSTLRRRSPSRISPKTPRSSRSMFSCRYSGRNIFPTPLTPSETEWTKIFGPLRSWNSWILDGDCPIARQRAMKPPIEVPAKRSVRPIQSDSPGARDRRRRKTVVMMPRTPPESRARTRNFAIGTPSEMFLSTRMMGRFPAFGKPALPRNPRRHRGGSAGSSHTTVPDIGRISRVKRLHSLWEFQENERTFRAILETTTEWIWIIDRNLRHVYRNPAVFRIPGFTPEKFTRIDTLSVIHEQDREEVASLFQEAVAAKKGWSSQVFRWRHKDGSYRHLDHKKQLSRGGSSPGGGRYLDISVSDTKS